jgi:hypothetical protein
MGAAAERVSISVSSRSQKMSTSAMHQILSGLLAARWMSTSYSLRPGDQGRDPPTRVSGSAMVKQWDWSMSIVPARWGPGTMNGVGPTQRPHHRHQRVGQRAAAVAGAVVTAELRCRSTATRRPRTRP